MLTLQLLFYCFIICWSVCPSMKRLHKFSIFTFVGWALYKVYCGSFCMNRTTFREPWVGGVLVKTCIIALRRSTFLKEKQIYARALHGFAASPIEFNSHERKHVVIQFLIKTQSFCNGLILSFLICLMYMM